MTSTNNNRSNPIRTLRERCGISFSLTLSPPCLKPTSVPHKGQLQPTIGHLPRRQKRPSPPRPVQPPSPPSPNPPTPPPQPKPRVFSNLLFRRRQDKPGHPANPNVLDPLTHLHALPTGLDDLDDILATPLPHRFAMRDESRCLQEVIPGCSVAFEDDVAAWAGRRSKDSLATPNDGLEGWTHIVSISQAGATSCRRPSSSSSSSSSSSVDGASESGSSVSYNAAVQTLSLVLPPAPHSTAEDEDLSYTSLTAEQLIAARDFLSSNSHALRWDPSCPNRTYPSSSHSSCSSLSDSFQPSPAVRLLITAPRNCRADALSVAICYLSFAFNVRVNTFLRNLDNGNRCLPVWKRVLDREGVQFVESVVAM